LNYFRRNFKLLVISDKELFVLAGTIDTYIYLLYIRNLIYVITIMIITNCVILMPLYWTGDVSGICNNSDADVVYLT